VKEAAPTLGRSFEPGSAWPAGLARWPFAPEPLAAVLPAGHRLAERAQLTPDDLRQYGLWWPIAWWTPDAAASCRSPMTDAQGRCVSDARRIDKITAQLQPASSK